MELDALAALQEITRDKAAPAAARTAASRALLEHCERVRQDPGRRGDKAKAVGTMTRAEIETELETDDNRDQ